MRGPCAKRRVVCVLHCMDGSTFTGENDCENPQQTCPRAPGEDYTKCQAICQQGAHAEIKALEQAGDKAIGAVALLTGHYYICEPCGAALRDAGVKRLDMLISPALRR